MLFLLELVLINGILMLGDKMQEFEILKSNLAIAINGVGFINKGQEDLPPNYVFGEPKTYNFNNGVVSFIDEKGIAYITPVDKMIELLEKIGYSQAELFVPFSDSIPLAYQSQWQTLENAEMVHYFDNKVSDIIEESVKTI